MSGLLTIVVSVLMFCFAKHVAVLVIARALQGAATAVLWTSGVALVVDVTGPENMGFALGWLSMTMVAGMLAGPGIGGLVYDQAGFYPVFIVAGFLLFVDVVLRLLVIERRNAKSETLDPSRADHDPVGDDCTPNVPQDQDSQDPRRDLLETGNQSENSRWTSARERLAWKVPAILLLLRSPRFLVYVWASVIVAFSQAAFEAVRASQNYPGISRQLLTSNQRFYLYF